MDSITSSKYDLTYITIFPFLFTIVKHIEDYMKDKIQYFKKNLRKDDDIADYFEEKLFGE